MYDITPIESHNSIQTKNKSAEQITHFLKLFGNGNMNAGLKRIANTSYDIGEKSGFYRGKECGISIGEKRGIIEGAVGTLSTITVLYLIKFMVENKKERQALKTKKSTSLKDAENTSDDANIDSKSDTHKLDSHKV